MRVITLNLNGIRSAAKKGVFDWLQKQDADVICFQELKAQEHYFPFENYHAHFHFAEKKGYSGVAVYSREKPKKVEIGLGFETADREGRYVAVDLGSISVASLYMPSGTSGEERQAVKFDFLHRFENTLRDIQSKDQPFIICGDFNIAHQQIDLKNWRGNQKNSGFLPDERAWMDQLFDEFQFVDAFRTVNTLPEQYTWWSNRGQAWAKNVGWRIDYQITTPHLKNAVKSATIYKDERFSDHAPLTLDYEF